MKTKLGHTSNGNQRTIWIIVLILVALIPLFIAFDFSPVGGKNILLYSRAIKCGEWPMEAKRRLSFGAGGLSIEPATPFALMRLGKLTAYCGERETRCMEYKDNEDLNRDCGDVYRKYNITPTLPPGVSLE